MPNLINIYVIRHGSVAGQPALNPSLNAAGRQHAITSARQCMALTHAIPVISSPLLRCCQSADVLAQAWGIDYRIEPGVIEVPSPMQEPALRSNWLHSMLGFSWQHMQAQGEALGKGYAAELAQWQESLHKVVQENKQDVVIYSHFFVINALLSWATGQQDVVSSLPDYGSIFHFQYGESGLALLSRGAELPSVLS